MLASLLDEAVQTRTFHRTACQGSGCHHSADTLLELDWSPVYTCYAENSGRCCGLYFCFPEPYDWLLMQPLS